MFLRLNISFFILFLLLVSTVYSQSLQVNGIIRDSLSRQPLAFGSIGVSGTTIGTASNKEGKFVLHIPETYRDSLILVSYMGYRTQKLLISELEESVIIDLIQDEIMLDEIEVVAWSPWEYVLNAYNNIGNNYFSDPYLTTGYYNEFISENEVFLKFTEAVIETYNPAYGDTARISSRLVQARRGEDLGNIQFMRNKLEKRLSKEQKKALRKGEHWDILSIDDAVMSATFGGPRMILRNDPVRDTASFIDPAYRKYYKYEFAGYTSYRDEKVIKIRFESKRKLEHRKRKGLIFISLDSDAFVAFDFRTRIIIPDAIRPLIFVYGLGVEDPELHAVMHYRPFNDRWFVNDLTIDASTDLTDRNMFKKNIVSNFNLFQSLVNESIDLDNIVSIPKEEQLDNWKPLEEQVEEDPDFWKNYELVKPDLSKRD